MPDVAAVLLGPRDVAARTAPAVGPNVVPAVDAAAVADSAAVVGVATAPWPGFAATHDEVRGTVAPAPYFAVQSWHRHPAYLERLVGALERARVAAGGDAHVLFTAPGPASEAAPEDVVFLRETAEAVSGLAGVTRRSIAWTSGVLGPSSLTALTALKDAHGRTTVLRCSLDPLARPDGVAGEAAAVGLALTEACLDPDDLAPMLAAVVATVVAHEGLDGGGR